MPTTPEASFEQTAIKKVGFSGRTRRAAIRTETQDGITREAAAGEEGQFNKDTGIIPSLGVLGELDLIANVPVEDDAITAAGELNIQQVHPPRNVHL